MRRIYIAGRFSRQAEFNEYAKMLRVAGATIDCRWLKREENDWSAATIRAGDLYSQTKGRAAAVEDYRDVSRSNMLLSFTENDDAGYTSGGRHVEFGIAYTYGLRLVIVGPRENVFHCFDGVEQFDTFEAFMKSDFLVAWLSYEGIR